MPPPSRGRWGRSARSARRTGERSREGGSDTLQPPVVVPAAAADDQGEGAGLSGSENHGAAQPVAALSVGAARTPRVKAAATQQRRSGVVRPRKDAGQDISLLAVYRCARPDQLIGEGATRGRGSRGPGAMRDASVADAPCERPCPAHRALAIASSM